jgi:DNA polymerase III delta prime subunit
VELYVEYIHPIQWNKKAFDQLVLEERTKKLVKALIEVRISAERMGDVIEGKGNGLIMLLHGSPGTGKTLTAGRFALYVSISSANNIYRKVSCISTPQESITKQDEHSVAEIAEKPLYRVTCGDLGTQAKDVEKYMNKVLYLGKIWGCGKLIRYLRNEYMS